MLEEVKILNEVRKEGGMRQREREVRGCGKKRWKVGWVD